MVNFKAKLTALVVLSAILSLTASKKKPLSYNETPHDFKTNNETEKIYNQDHQKFYGQLQAIQNTWYSKRNDQFHDEKDDSKKVLQVNWWNYEEMIVDPENGEFISEKPWFLIFIHANSYESNINIPSMQRLANYFDGKVQFGFVSVPMEESLAYAYEVISWPRMFYLNEEGYAHAFPKGFAAFEATKQWIEDREYKKSPQIFKAPKRYNKYMLWWGYAKKDVRTYYVANVQPTLEFYLRKTPFTYVYDKDPTDFENLKLNQKTNRQIIFIAAGFMWILELIWDLIVSMTCPPKKEKKKSILNRKVAAKKDEDEKDGDKKDEKKEDKKEEKKGDKKKKEKRDKVE